MGEELGAGGSGLGERVRLGMRVRGSPWEIAPTEIAFRDSDRSSRAHPGYVPAVSTRPLARSALLTARKNRRWPDVNARILAAAAGAAEDEGLAVVALCDGFGCFCFDCAQPVTTRMDDYSVTPKSEL